ncbi:MAG: AAA family ATPase, partial [Bryobacteraceae bacterium]
MPLDSFPAWARLLSEKYYSGTISMFVLHGNVHDLVPLRTDTGAEFVPLSRFLDTALFGQRDLVLHYDRGGGITFAKPEMQEDFRKALA